MSRHYVYRCFDADGLLLYVGCAGNVKRRIGQHRRGRTRAGRSLAALMASHTVEGPYSDRATAEAAEQAAIHAESPLLNIAHGSLPGWLANHRLADYLTDRGLPISVGGLHLCENCGILRGWHMTPGLCTDCREGLIEPRVAMRESANTT